MAEVRPDAQGVRGSSDRPTSPHLQVWRWHVTMATSILHRGAIIAVYDLRRRLDLGASALTRSSVVIVVDLGDRLAGILADAVSDILNVTSEELRAAPDVAGNSADLLQALVVKGDDVIALLHLAAIGRE